MKKLSVLSLTLITVCSVDSVRNLPVAASAGDQLFYYFTLALIFFLLPCAIIVVWFSKQSQQGIYGWIKKGLGVRCAFMAIWFQCLQNVLIYPTLLSFIAGALLYTLAPNLIENKIVMYFMILALIWSLTAINLRGIHYSSRLNIFCTMAGLLIPFGVIIIIGLYWSYSQEFSINLIHPPTPVSWTSITAIILSFCGIELAAVYAKESHKRAYPKAIISAVFLIFFSMLCGSMILAMIIPTQQLNYISSIPQLIHVFFTKVHYESMSVVINLLITIGCIGTANNWLLAPIKGLSFAEDTGFLNQNLMRLNKHNVPARLLIIQAFCISFISTLFIIIPTINTSYWLLINAATQIYLLNYLLLFFSAIKLVLNSPINTKIKIMIPCILGLLGVHMTLLVSLAPPTTAALNTQLFYILAELVFLTLMIVIPLRQTASYSYYSNRTSN